MLYVCCILSGHACKVVVTISRYIHITNGKQILVLKITSVYILKVHFHNSEQQKLYLYTLPLKLNSPLMLRKKILGLILPLETITCFQLEIISNTVSIQQEITR